MPGAKTKKKKPIAKSKLRKPYISGVAVERITIDEVQPPTLPEVTNSILLARVQVQVQVAVRPS